MAIYEKRASVGGFLKKGEDFNVDDLLEIANEGKKVPGKFKEQDVFLVKIGEKEGNIGVNQTSINGFIDAWGPDSVKWIGKKIKVWKVKANVAGKFLDVWYYSHPDAGLTEDGFVLPKSVQSEPEAPKTAKLEGEDEVRVEDIPF